MTITDSDLHRDVVSQENVAILYNAFATTRPGSPTTDDILVTPALRETFIDWAMTAMDIVCECCHESEAVEEQILRALIGGRKGGMTVRTREVKQAKKAKAVECVQA